MIVLNGLPPRITIERRAGTHCDDYHEKYQGCATLEGDSCYITLDHMADKDTLIHELAHCAGLDEETARGMAEP